MIPLAVKLHDVPRMVDRVVDNDTRIHARFKRQTVKRLREALTEPTDSALFIEAGKWFEQRNN